MRPPEGATAGALDALLASSSAAPAARAWRGYVYHCLLFYRQNALGGSLPKVRALGGRFSLGPGADPAPAPGGRDAAAEVSAALGLAEKYWGSTRPSDAALERLARAEALAPRSPWPPLLQALVHETHRRYVRAIACADRAAALDPGWAWPLVLRGISKWYLADFHGSIEDFSAAAARAPGAELPLLFRARAKADVRDRTLVADLDAALKLSPRSGFALSWRGRALFVLDRARQALGDLRRSIAALPDYDRGYSWLGVSLIELGEPAAALPLLRKARRLNPSYPTTLYPLARACFAAGRWSEAGRALKEAAAVDRHGVWVEHRISMSHPNQACLRSLADLERYLERFPREAWALAWRGQTRLLLQDYRAALSDLDAALRLSPADPWARLWRGEARRRLGLLEQAQADLTAALAARRLSWALAARGFCRAGLGRARAALRDLDASLALQPRCAPAHAWRGEVLAGLERWAEAERAFAAAAELRPQDSWLDAKLAVCRDGAGLNEAADLSLERLSRRLHEGHPVARALAEGRRAQALALLRRQEREGAAAFFSEENLRRCAERESPEAARALERGELARALSLCGELPASRPDVQGRLLRGWLKLRTGDRWGALEESARVLDFSLDPLSAPARRLRAQALEAA